jgi:hypothetical protein
VATTADEILRTGSPPPTGTGKVGFAPTIDRWIYVFMAVVFVVATLVGFIPDSLDKMAAVNAGLRPPFPPILHVHAVLMGSWLMLLLAQTVLMATGRPKVHRTLGLAALAVAPAMVVTGLIFVPLNNQGMWDAVAVAPPGAARTAAQAAVAIVNDVLLYQIRDGILFSVLVFLALRARRADAGTHKRLLILATAILIPAAFVRMTWLPTTMPQSPNSIVLLTLLLIAPMFLWDLFRLRRVHRAYALWLACYVPLTVTAGLLWGTTWWLQTGPRLLGVSA